MNFESLEFIIKNDIGHFEIFWQETPNLWEKLLGKKGRKRSYNTPHLNKVNWKKFDQYSVIWYDSCGTEVTDPTTLSQIRMVMDIMRWDDTMFGDSHEVGRNF